MLARFNAGLKDVAQSERANAGKLVGQGQARVQEALSAREGELAVAEETQRLAEEAVDVTAVPSRWRAGARHPLSLLMEQMGDIFIGMGWEIAEGPELENEWFNFDAMNFDEDHPAGRCRTRSSSIRSTRTCCCARTRAPCRSGRCSTGRCRCTSSRPARRSAPTSSTRRTRPVFHQIEGLAIDKGLTMAHLRGTLEHLARAMFGAEAQIRLRPNYFPFTEPSAEMDVYQPNAKGGARWVEWGGCGMVNRNVLRAAGIDPDVYQGFAFGMGIERTLQFRNDMNDMRDMVEGDIRFSQQFGMSA